jgi:hypothetical protein
LPASVLNERTETEIGRWESWGRRRVMQRGKGRGAPEESWSSFAVAGPQGGRQRGQRLRTVFGPQFRIAIYNKDLYENAFNQFNLSIWPMLKYSTPPF